MELSEREQQIINLLTNTPHLFQDDETWSGNSEGNKLTVGQVLQVRTWIQRKVLDLQFMQEFVEQVTAGPCRDDGKAHWWQRCTVDFWLKNLRPVRRAVQSHAASRVAEIHEGLYPVAPADELFSLDMQAEIYRAMAIVPGDTLTPRQIKQLGTALPAPTTQDPISREGHRHARAMQGLMVLLYQPVIEASMPGAVAAVTESVRPEVLEWLHAHPRHAQWFIKTVPNFRFWFGISDDVQYVIDRDAAHIHNSRCPEFIRNYVAAR